MNRRKFFGLGFAAATMPASAAALTAVSVASASADVGPVGRVSVDETDPGYRAYCIARGDRKIVKVFLNGVEEREVKTADAVEGWLIRAVITPEGNLAHDGENILEETVYGAVRIEIV